MNPIKKSLQERILHYNLQISTIIVLLSSFLLLVAGLTDANINLSPSDATLSELVLGYCGIVVVYNNMKK